MRRLGARRMALTNAERERITDSRAKLQSVARSLKHVDPKAIPGVAEIEDCLEDADKSLTGALRSKSVGPDQKK
jgi:hypothetical protein